MVAEPAAAKPLKSHFQIGNAQRTTNTQNDELLLRICAYTHVDRRQRGGRWLIIMMMMMPIVPHFLFSLFDLLFGMIFIIC